MANNVFLLDDARGLVEMRESPYAAESLLQELLEKYPSLLAGDPEDDDEERRLVLVRREAAVPDAQDGGGRWSLDHLFVDQNGVPTLVEVKRSSDTRIRREVVGQMLDYAAHAVAHWNVEGLLHDFEATCEQADRDPDEVLTELLGEDADADAFWQDVKTNLGAGRVRMVFVADAIPTEVRRVIEFLNDQMNPAEVLAIEVKQYLGDQEGVRTLVPRVLGQTTRAQERKRARLARGPRRDWSDEAILADIRANGEGAAVDVAQRILEWGRARSFESGFVGGPKQGARWFAAPSHPQPARLVYVWSTGNVGLSFDRVKNAAPFEPTEVRRELADRLERIEGVSIPDKRLGGSPKIPLSLLQDAESLRLFFRRH